MISEFSTGIKVDGTAEKWVSRGFSGEYMNKVGGDCPAILHNAIRNRMFAAAEGSTEQPAFIMRVLSDGEKKCAVIAVLSRAQDEFGRGVTLYRYFHATPKEGGMNALIEHFKDYQEKTGHLPVFDPFETPNELRPKKELLGFVDLTPLKGLAKGITCGGSLGVREAWDSLLTLKKQDDPKDTTYFTNFAVAVGCKGLEKPDLFGRIHTTCEEDAKNIIRYLESNKTVRTKTSESTLELNPQHCQSAISSLIASETLRSKHIPLFQQMRGIAQKQGGQAVIESIFKQGGLVPAHRLKAQVIFCMLVGKTFKQTEDDSAKNSPSDIDAALKVLGAMEKALPARDDIKNSLQQIKNSLQQKENNLVQALLRNFFQR
ncbi:MAG: hypothetical protein ACK5UY_05665 [Holosporales bacterium]